MNGGLLANKLINNREFNRAACAAQTRCSQAKDSEEPANAKRHIHDAQRLDSGALPVTRERSLEPIVRRAGFYFRGNALAHTLVPLRAMKK